jgi:hypothetical protein
MGESGAVIAEGRGELGENSKAKVLEGSKGGAAVGDVIDIGSLADGVISTERSAGTEIGE